MENILMKGIVTYLLIAVGLALAGVLFLSAGRLDRDMAHAQQSASAMKYDEADQTFARVERYLDYASRVPWVGNGPVNDVRMRRASLQYWQGKYDAIPAEPPADNIGLQLVAANAAYRAGRIEAKDRQSTLDAVDAGIQAYTAVLRNSTGLEDAAYNYEYLVRTRGEIEQSRVLPKLPRGPSDANGITGNIIEPGDGSGFKIYVPLDNEEREKAGGAGKVGPIKRKG